MNDDNERMRLNYYHTGTVQIQIGSAWNGGRIFKNVDLETLEGILETY